MKLESTAPILLNDEQMREYIANGYVILRPSLSEELHRTIDEKFNWIQEHEFNPGNNIVPRLPELELILRNPEAECEEYLRSVLLADPVCDVLNDLLD